MLGNANCLVLDEPTNHLDIDSAEALETAIEDFEGTVIVISHDRYFLDRITDHTVEVHDGEITRYEGGYSAWVEAKKPRPPDLGDEISAARAREAPSAPYRGVTQKRF
jgi:ATP-binding cassette, subfamily F, member 3